MIAIDTLAHFRGEFLAPGPRVPTAKEGRGRSGALAEAIWRAVGAAVARLHRLGVDHADLNAHNILLGSAGIVSVIDFDRGQLRAPGAWTLRNLARLKHSLQKIAAALPKDRFTPASWEELLAGYQAA